MDIRKKYIGLQSVLKGMGAELALLGDGGCLFLCLCSIAEEYNEGSHNGRRVDILRLAADGMARGWLGHGWYCVDQAAVLEHATGVPWRKGAVSSLPAEIPAEMYTVEKWHNPRTGYDHFRRRWGDTLDASVTVRDGRLVGYYTYTHGAAPL